MPLRSFAINYWSHELCKRRHDIQKLSLADDCLYGNAFVSRFYMDYLNKEDQYDIVKQWKQVFFRRNVYTIEGEFSRLGVGNDLFSTASSIHRILAPAKNAFSSYQLKLRTPETLMRQGFIRFSDIRHHHIMHTVSGTFPIDPAVLPRTDRVAG